MLWIKKLSIQSWVKLIRFEGSWKENIKHKLGLKISVFLLCLLLFVAVCCCLLLFVCLTSFSVCLLLFVCLTSFSVCCCLFDVVVTFGILTKMLNGAKSLLPLPSYTLFQNLTATKTFFVSTFSFIFQFHLSDNKFTFLSPACGNLAFCELQLFTIDIIEQP